MSKSLAARTVLSLMVMGMPAAGTPAAAQHRPYLGMALSCSYCEWQTVGARSVFRFSRPPVVEGTDPGGPADRGGLRVGDVLLAIDGRALTDSAGAARLSEARPADTLRVRYRRGDSSGSVLVVAGEAPAAGGRAGLGRALSAVGEALQRGPVADAPRRFTGNISDVAVEVRGSPDVSVMVRGNCDLEIVTPTARIRLKAPAGCERRLP